MFVETCCKILKMIYVEFEVIMKLYDFQAKTHIVIWAKNIEEAERIGVEEMEDMHENLSFDPIGVSEICNETEIPPGWEDGYPYGEYDFDATLSEYFKLPKSNIVKINGKKYKMVEVEE